MQKKGIKVNLALIDDVKARIEETKTRLATLSTAFKNMNQIVQNFEKAKINLNDEYGFANSLTTVNENALKRTVDAAKLLGLDPNSIAEVKQLQTIEQSLFKLLIEADKVRQKYK
jgi:hypothetical protein